MDWARSSAMTELGNGLFRATHYEDALAVREAQLSTLRRLSASERDMIRTQSNLATSYEMTGRCEALDMRRDMYSGYLRILGEEHMNTLITASNYAASLRVAERSVESKSLLRKMVPIARRVLGDNAESTVRMRVTFARALYEDISATLDDLREAVATLEETARIARRVFGKGAHPIVSLIESSLPQSRIKLRARETPPPGSA